MIPRLNRSQVQLVKSVSLAGDEITIAYHYPSFGEKALAADLAGLEFSEEGSVALNDSAPVKGTVGLLVSQEMFHYWVGRICIDKVEGLPELQAPQRCEKYPGLSILSDEVTALISTVDLKEIGKQVISQSEITDAEKKG